MGKKTDSTSSRLTPSKGVTPKILFKKDLKSIIKPKKKNPRPFNNRIKKKNSESKIPNDTVEELPEDVKNQKKVQKEKKKKSPNKCTKKSKKDVAEKEKSKKVVKAVDKFDKGHKVRGVKNITKQNVIVSKKKTTGKPVKNVPVKATSLNAPVKASSSVKKTAEKMTKKAVQKPHKNDIKGKKKKAEGSSGPAGKEKKARGRPKTKKSLSEAPPDITKVADDKICSNPLDKASKSKKDQDSQTQTNVTHESAETRLQIKQKKVTENVSEPDSLVRSYPPEDLAEATVYGREEDHDSLSSQSLSGLVEEPDSNDSVDSCSTLSASNFTMDFNSLISQWQEIVIEQPDEQKSSDVLSGSEELSEVPASLDDNETEMRLLDNDSQIKEFKDEQKSSDVLSGSEELSEVPASLDDNETEMRLLDNDSQIKEFKGSQDLSEVSASQDNEIENIMFNETYQLEEFKGEQTLSNDLSGSKELSEVSGNLDNGETEYRPLDKASQDMTSQSEEFKGSDQIFSDNELSELSASLDDDETEKRPLDTASQDKNSPLEEIKGSEQKFTEVISVSKELSEASASLDDGEAEQRPLDMASQDKTSQLEEFKDECNQLYSTTENVSPLKTTVEVEDDLYLSTSISQCSSRSSISSGSVDGLYELSKIKKSKKRCPDRSETKLTLKKQKEEKQIEKRFHRRDSSMSRSSAYSECNDQQRRTKKPAKVFGLKKDEIGEKLIGKKLRNRDSSTSSENSEQSGQPRINNKRSLLESGLDKQEIDNVLKKRKCTDMRNLFSPPYDCRENSLSPQKSIESNIVKFHQYRESDSPNSKSPGSNATLSPSRHPVIVLRRLEQDECTLKNNALKHDSSIPKTVDKKNTPLREAEVFSEKSVVENQTVLRPQSQNFNTQSVLEVASSKYSKSSNLDSYFSKSHVHFSGHILEDKNFDSEIKCKAELNYLNVINFYLDCSITDLHFLPEDCTVSLTKIDCVIDDMKEEKQKTVVNPTPINLQRIESNVEQPKQIDRSRDVNPMSVKFQGSGRTYSRMQALKSTENCSFKGQNFLVDQLHKEEKNVPKVYNPSSKVNSKSSISSYEGIDNSLKEKPNCEVIKPKLSKLDLLKRKNNPFNQNKLKYADNQTVPSIKDLQIPTRKVINNNNARKIEPPNDPSFKQPQTYPVRKLNNTIKFESRISSSDRTKQSNIAFNATPVVLSTQKAKTKLPISMDMESLMKTQDLKHFCTQSNSCYNEEREDDFDDDNQSTISIFPNPDLCAFLDDVIKERETTIGHNNNKTQKQANFTQSQTYPRKISFSQNSQKQSDEFQINPRPAMSDFHVNEGQTRQDQQQYRQQEQYNGLKSLTNGNTEIDLRNNICESRFGNPILKPYVMEDRIEPKSPSLRSRSSSSGSHYYCGSDSVPYGNFLEDTPFNGYCLFYLRSSTPKNEVHQCDLQHEVPSQLFNSSSMNNRGEMKKLTARGISIITKEHCTNPPLKLLDGISTFLIQNDQKQELKNVVDNLKNNITVAKVGFENYQEIWTYFTKKLIEKIIWSCQHPATHIDYFLRVIVVDDNQEIREETKLILSDALVHLAKKSVMPSIRLLDCVKFLREFKLTTEFYPFSFIEAVLSQFIIKARNTIEKNTIVKFSYLVYKWFFSDMSGCRYVYKNNRHLTEEFLKTAMVIFSYSNSSINAGEQVKIKLDQLRMEFAPLSQQMVSLNSNARGIKEDSSNERPNEKPRIRIKEQETFGSFNATNSGYNKPKNSSVTTTTSTSQTIVITGRTPRQVFDDFRTRESSEYLEIIQRLDDSVKKKYNDVTMSLLLLESRRENNWNLCYSLFEEIVEFHPITVQDFINNNVTPARRLLVIITCCLKSHHLEEAVDLYLRYGLYEVDHVKWKVKALPEDIKLWTEICLDFKIVLNDLPKFEKINYAQLLVAIIQHQKSLRTPIDLQIGLNKFFWKASSIPSASSSPFGWKAMYTVVSAIIKENLIKKLLVEEIELYRILIVAISKEDPGLCARLMSKSNKYCKLYPETWSAEASEVSLKSCLTSEELYAYFAFKLRIYKDYFEMKSLDIIFEEYHPELSSWRTQYFRHVDCSIEAVIERFMLVCKRVGLEPRSLIVYKNKITVDKIMVQNRTESSLS